jgi:hypothetical protein
VSGQDRNPPVPVDRPDLGRWLWSTLGPVDGFDQDESASESDGSAIAVLSFVASHGNSLEALQLADRPFDPGAGLVEQSGEESGPVLGVLAIRNDRDDATAAQLSRRRGVPTPWQARTITCAGRNGSTLLIS